EAGGMIYYNHSEQRLYQTDEALETLAAKEDYASLVEANQIVIDDLPESEIDPATAAKRYQGDMETAGRFVAYTHNQESFKFLMDPMLQNGIEKVSAMGYGNAINSLTDQEGGVAKYFSQRFAQVTNPPLDSIREADGMTLRVALGEKPHFGKARAKQIVVHSPILRMVDMLKIRSQQGTPWKAFEILYEPVFGDKEANQTKLVEAIDAIANEVVDFARDHGGIAILTDRHISKARAALPSTIAVSAINQRLIEEGLRFKVSLVLESGQIASSHHIACSLGFGAAAVYPLAVRLRAEQSFGEEGAREAFGRFKKAAEKSLMKTMGKVGLCTVESYSGGEFFEPNFLDTNDPVLARYLPNMKCPVGGVQFDTIAQSVADWHERALAVEDDNGIPILGLFKERSEGAGHSYGTTAVRGFVDMTEERISFEKQTVDDPSLGDLTLRQLEDAYGIAEEGYVNTSYDMLTPDEIDGFEITPGYRAFIKMMYAERAARPAALRDVLATPVDLSAVEEADDFAVAFSRYDLVGNNNFFYRGLECEAGDPGEFTLTLPHALKPRLQTLSAGLIKVFGDDIVKHAEVDSSVRIRARGRAEAFLSRLGTAPPSIPLDQVQPASEITPSLASGAMSHGALVATAHEAVAHGTNMVGAMSNSGEGGEHSSRYGTIRASRIKQFASGRFGVWAGYLADPNLEEIEIKIAQGAKPGEGGQLPGFKVPVEIAAARGGTPGVELISPPPHHDTYSIEDLGQLIHDAKAARVRVIVKLVSSEGIGTIAVGVAKAGADLINVAGSSGGTGAAAVTSLKYTGRAAEIGISEVHQALCRNGIRQKVLLRCSGAMQTGSDVVKAALLGADSFEFGTTALMMLKCVMA
ncbi:MAG: glutamate synthase-related protein, partial [Verrucomicrobiota bacterium]